MNMAACGAVCLLTLACGAQEPEVFTARLPQAGGFITAEAVIAGKPLRMMVDSGASVIGLDPQAAPVAVHFESVMSLENAFGENSVHRMGRVTHWTVGGIGRVTDEVVAVDLAMLNRALGLKIGGFLGLRALGARYVTLDYDKELLTASDVAGEGTYENSLPISWRTEMPYVNATFGAHTVKMLIDTGFNSTMTLPVVVFDDLVKAGMIRKAKEAGLTGTGATIRETRVGWFTAGELMGQPLAGCHVGSEEGETGLLGQSWLLSFNMRISTGYASGKLEYTLRKNAPRPLVVDNMLGAILIYQDGKVLVERIFAQGGAAEKAGLKAGDRILKLGELDESEINRDALRPWLATKVRQNVTCTILRASDGTSVEATLAIGDPVTEWRDALPGEDK
ncbi:MAG: hypothetical protein ACO1TE_26515 [Prosthecobacter sp.]